MLNNGVFGETGGHITSHHGPRPAHQEHARRVATAEAHGYPIRLSTMLAQLEGVAIRGPVCGEQRRQRRPHPRMLRRAFEAQLADEGFSFVEILTMCPTGWFIDTHEAPDYLETSLASVHVAGILKDGGLGRAPSPRDG
jgi:2-oxoglutarate/2-oxoacid ferredoxin oxidoreductase subunit beta